MSIEEKVEQITSDLTTVRKSMVMLFAAPRTNAHLRGIINTLLTECSYVAFTLTKNHFDMETLDLQESLYKKINDTREEYEKVLATIDRYNLCDVTGGDALTGNESGEIISARN